MSRTYRKTHHWTQEHLAYELADSAISRVRYYNVEKRIMGYLSMLRGQDGKTINNIGEASSGKPNGYDTWGYVGGKVAKRFAKRKAARIMRARGGKEIKQHLLELHEEQTLDRMEQERLDHEAETWYSEWDKHIKTSWGDDDDYEDYIEPEDDYHATGGHDEDLFLDYYDEDCGDYYGRKE